MLDSLEDATATSLDIPTDDGSATSGDWPLLRPEVVAHMLDVPISWVYDAVRSRRLPCRRIGRHIRFTRRMIEAWVAEQPGA